MSFMWLGHSYNQRTKIILIQSVSDKNPGCNCAIHTYLKQISSLVYIYQYLRQNTCHRLYSSEGYKHNDLCSCCHCLIVCLWETVLPLHLSLWGTLRSIQVSASKQETISTCIYSPPAPLTHLMSTQSHKIDKLSVPPVALNISAAVSN